MTKPRRSAVVATLVVVAAVVAAGLLTPPADAASYRYWTYWLGGSGGWDFSSRGADRIPADGSVDGWRFAISEAASSSERPSISSSFDAICSDTQPVDGKKRVGLVIDYGTASDAPPGEEPPHSTVARCLVLPVGANAYDALAAVTSMRIDQGLICGISGYPRSGCGEPVADPKPTSTVNGSAGDRGDGSDESGAGSDSTGDRATPTDDGGSPGNRERADDDRGDKDANAGQDRQNTRQDAAPQPLAADDQAEVNAALDTPLEAPLHRGSPLPLVLGGALLVGLIAGSMLLARRRR
jgi:hypothetical protein